MNWEFTGRHIWILTLYLRIGGTKMRLLNRLPDHNGSSGCEDIAGPNTIHYEARGFQSVLVAKALTYKPVQSTAVVLTT